MKKYHKVSKVNHAWNSHYDSFNDIHPPKDCQMFLSQYLYNSQYGKDLFQWYQHSLVKHFNKLAGIANKIFINKEIPLGVKLSGVHWKYFKGRTAEICAGYVDKDYHLIIEAIKKQNFELTITCLEMENSSESGITNILEHIYEECKKQQVKLCGENALPLYKSYLHPFTVIRNNILRYNISGFTLLRWDFIQDEEYLKICKQFFF
jgi:hypothetical protein